MMQCIPHLHRLHCIVTATHHAHAHHPSCAPTDLTELRSTRIFYEQTQMSRSQQGLQAELEPKRDVPAEPESESRAAMPYQHAADEVTAHRQKACAASRPTVHTALGFASGPPGGTVTITTEIRCSVVADATAVPAGCTKVHFVRHGEGTHNLAQRAWRAAPSWDGASEPYTIENDPEWKYMDAELTPKGKQEAMALRPRTASYASSPHTILLLSAQMFKIGQRMLRCLAIICSPPIIGGTGARATGRVTHATCDPNRVTGL